MNVDLNFNIDNYTGFADAKVHFELDDLKFYLDIDTKLP